LGFFLQGSPPRWECGNRAAISTGWGKRGETWVWFSPFSTRPSFPRRSPVSCALALLTEGQKKLSFGCWHSPGRLRVAVLSRELVQALDAESRLQIAFGLRGSARQFAQPFPRRGVAPPVREFSTRCYPGARLPVVFDPPAGPVHELFFAARIGNSLRLSARAMKVQMGIEGALLEPVDGLGVFHRNVAVAHMFADDCPVFPFH
jgi:hypothetical protein